ncbi:MAG: NlpC/P60 family protein [Thermodesulfobacteriota bacterium]
MRIDSYDFKWPPPGASGLVTRLLPLIILTGAIMFFSSGCVYRTAALKSTNDFIPPVFASGLTIPGLIQESCTMKAGEELARRFNPDQTVPTNLTQPILATAYTQTGKPFLVGGCSAETGFDSAGFTQWVFARHGIKLPGTPKAQLEAGAPVEKSDLRPGDLVFYWRIKGSQALHVALYTGAGKIIHSPLPGERVQESDAFDRYRLERYVGARRFLDEPAAAPLPQAQKEAIIRQAQTANLPAGEDLKAKSEETEAQTLASLPEQIQKEISQRPPAAKQFRARTFRPPSASQVKGRVTGATQTSKRSEVQTASQKSERKSSRDGNKSYQIKPGDTIWVVAQKLRVSPHNLMQVNNLSSQQILRIGQTLSVP